MILSATVVPHLQTISTSTGEHGALGRGLRHL